MPNDLNLPEPQYSLRSASSSRLFTPPELFNDSKKQKLGPKIYKIHRGFASNSLQIENDPETAPEPKPEPSCPVRKINEPPVTRSSSFRALSLPQIDVLKGRDDFALSSIGSLKKDWFVTTVNQTIGGSKIVVRRRNSETVCMEHNSALEAVQLRRRRAWIRNIWQRNIQKVISCIPHIIFIPGTVQLKFIQRKLNIKTPRRFFPILVLSNP